MQIELVATDVDLSFLPDIEDVHLGGVDGVEDEGEDQRQDEGHPASHKKVEDGAEGNFYSPDVHRWSIIVKSQDSQARENIWDLTCTVNDKL